MRKTKLKIEWEKRIAAFKSSGQTQAKWCADNNLKLHRLKYLLNDLKDLNLTRAKNQMSFCRNRRNS